MIVKMTDSNSDKYIKLFTEAYRFLSELEGKNYVPAGRERFSSLAEYYGHISDLFDEQKYEYIMVPQDEDLFEIDLNTRSIAVPASFSKCASVQTDQLAETIIFISDRYFDFMDLMNTEIYVQWTTPDGIKGATRVEMRDPDSEQGKIKFAWPLNDLITRTPGPVKFSVRYFRLDSDSALVYNLNTLSSEIIIKPALQPTGESFVEEPINDNLFKKAIINSRYSTTGVNPPVQPEYAEPGSNITTLSADPADQITIVGHTKISGLKDNTRTLYVQAIARDAGEITYKWYYNAANDFRVISPVPTVRQEDAVYYYKNEKDEFKVYEGEIPAEITLYEKSGLFFDCEEYPIFDINGNPVRDENGELMNTTTFGTVNNDVYLPINPKPTSRVANERYYVADGAGYKLYTEEISETLPVEQLYERYSAYTVADSGEIIGNYKAVAWNNISIPAEQKVLTTPFGTQSDVCLLPGPQDIVITKDLKDIAVVQRNSNIALAVDIEQDAYKPEVIYTWKTSTLSEADISNSDSVGSEKSITITEPGWYRVDIESKLNRRVEHQSSAVCKVTHPPIPPQVVVQDSYYDTIPSQGVTFEINVDPAILDVNNKLLSDKIEYKWQMTILDGNVQKAIWHTLTGKEEGITIDGNKLTVTRDLPYSVAEFRCLVINELNKMKTVFDHSNTYIPSIENEFGEFITEVNDDGETVGKVPYVYDNTDGEDKDFDFIVRNSK